MNAITTPNPKTLLGPGDFTDHDYDRWDAKSAAIDAAIDWQIDDLQSTTQYKYAKDTIESAMELIADNKRGEQDQLNRWLFQVWQHRNAKPDTTGRKLRDYAMSVIAQLLNSAIMDVVTKKTKEEYC